MENSENQDAAQAAQAAPDTPAAQDAGDAVQDAGGGAPRDMAAGDVQAIMQAVIYVADEPVRTSQFRDVFPGEDPKALERMLREMVEDFNRRPGGMQIREVAGGWRMTTRPEHHEHIRAYLKTRPNAKLSLAALETLAVIAYKQPVTLAEISAIRGKKSSDAVIRTLMDKHLVAMLGCKQVVGKPRLYGTSKEFLIHFGLNSLADLPTLEEFAQLVNEQS
ncbi:MAG: SMC-Scp complex subunit ScpB [Acidobacteriota bacterium]|jgi:segregation and condensation protein B|nr:SMC-Scp complex subunit ScpB [Acidobacteriota bacterium]